MKRIKVVGLCLLAVFAVAAVAASGASAAEVGECLKASPKNTGNYTDKSCQTKVVGTGKYEWSPGTTPANSVYATKAKASRLFGVTGEIKCSKQSSVGKWTGPKTQEVVVAFTGCEAGAPLNAECHSKTPAAAGEIITNTLAGTILGEGESADGYKGSTVGAGEVWDQLQAPGGITEYQAEYLCGGVEEIKTKGESAGVYSAGSINVASKKTELNWTPGGGDQSILSDGFGAVPFANAPATEEVLGVKGKGPAKLVIKA